MEEGTGSIVVGPADGEELGDGKGLDLSSMWPYCELLLLTLDKST